MDANRTYQASRLTNGNFIFPDLLTVADDGIDFVKRGWFGSQKEHINYQAIASVKTSNGILFSTLQIETSGGSQPIVINGLYKQDAADIEEAIRQRAAASRR